MMKKLLLALAMLMLLTVSAFAEKEWAVEKYTLKNGLTLLTLEDASTPALSFQVWYHVGSKNERPGITGISHLFEHMMFKGSKNFADKEHDRLIQSSGGMLNAYTSNDMTVYHEEFGTEMLETVAKLEADRMQYLTITDTQLASERQVVLEERNERIDNSPFGDVLEQLMGNLFLAHSYGWMTIGWRKDVETLTLDDCLNYYNTYYNPANATIVVVGDMKTADTQKLIEKYFGKIPGNPKVPRPIYNEPEQKGERRIAYHKVSQLPLFIAGYHCPAAGHSDSYALDVLSAILSGGESSRAYQRMVYKDQIAIAAGGQYQSMEQAGVFFAFSMMQPGKTTEDGEKALYEEIERLKTEPVTAEELQKAKNQIEAQFYMGNQSNDDKAGQLGYFAAVMGDYKLLFQQADKYNAVTADDVMRVAKTYLGDRNRTVVNVIQENKGAA
ncbi:MAG: pitrilysin family protein, partial [Candidatus Zixiibacteriota bacterium]